MQISVVFHTFTGLRNHHHCLVLGHFHHWGKKTPIGVILPFPFPPVLPQSTSSLHEFAYSRHFLQMESYNVFFCTKMFTAVLLIIFPKWKQLQMSINWSKDKQKEVCSHNRVLSGNRKNKVLIHNATGMNLEKAMLSEESLTQKDADCIPTHFAFQCAITTLQMFTGKNNFALSHCILVN